MKFFKNLEKLVSGPASDCNNPVPECVLQGVRDVPVASLRDAVQNPQKLGKYLVARRLGQGGMGEVFEATDPDLGRQVALKLIASIVDDEPARERFRQEVRSAASLMHPNVVAVHGVDTSADGRPFLVMELVTGGSAADSVRARGHLPWREATRILIDACRGIAAAPAAGLIHRDIKPANLLLAADGSAKVGDFGLARSMSPEARRLTGSRLVLGTAYYMSPEQSRGDEPVNDLSDVYSLGATYFRFAHRSTAL